MAPGAGCALRGALEARAGLNLTHTHNFCDTQSAQTGGWSNNYKPTDEMKKYINRYINITVFLCFVMKVCKKEKKKKEQIPNFLKNPSKQKQQQKQNNN